MAEARNAIDLYYLRKRGADIGADVDGYYSFTIRLPTFPVLVSKLSLSWHRAKYGLMNRLWPITPIGLITVMTGVSLGVINANEKSWVRTGWLADALWRLDSTMGAFNPIFDHYPVSLRVGYLASIAAFFGVLGVASLERFTLRGLLSWQGWIFGAKSRIGNVCLKMWGGAVKLLSGCKKMTYAFNASLPILPLPSLNDTCKSYLESVRPLLTDEEYADTVKLAEEFKANEGKSFQRYLRFKHFFSTNYVLEWWEKYCYLYGRTPIAINSNYYVLDAKERPTLDQCQRAAGITYQFLRFKDMIENETLEPMTLRGMIPLCMSQYQRMFGTCRVPGRDFDSLVHQNSRHIVVVSNGHYYVVDVYHGTKGTRLKRYSVDEIEKQLNLIVEHSKHYRVSRVTRTASQQRLSEISRASRVQSFEDLVVFESLREHIADFTAPKNKSKLSKSMSSANIARATLSSVNLNGEDRNVQSSPHGNIASFTAGPRGRWAEVRELYFSDGVNRSSLEKIESAAFIVFLDNNHYKTLDERAASLFHGDGSNRWFDKSINLVVFADGYAGLNCEHSWADAPVIAHLWEFSLLSELMDFQTRIPKKAPISDSCKVRLNLDQVDCLEEGESTDITPETKVLPVPKVLRWDIDNELQLAIDTAQALAYQLICDVDLEVVEHSQFGKGLIKKFGLSPDGFVQMALQLAYYRNRNKFDLTYESSMTRLFRGGRTETTRTLSNESVDFVLSMENSEIPVSVKIDKLRVACSAHAVKNKNMMIGKGIDRHLFALYITSKGFDRSSEFLNSVLSMPWRLSTSQQPQSQTNLRRVLPVNISDRFVSPGGGFGPVADDGYGVSYMFAGENKLFFHISSKISADGTSSTEFSKQLIASLRDMSEMFEEK